VEKQRYTNFRRAQRERGPYYKGARRHDQPPRKMFAALLVAMSLVTFSAVFFSEEIPAAAQATQTALRDLGRENTPQAGAYYSGCDDARSAGVAPLYRGEPGYRSDMDGDNDGIACEPYRGG
jgi:Excalibur calcium-binding domain